MATVRTEENRTLIVSAIKRGASFTIAADAAGIGRTSFYKWRTEDEQFELAIKKARNECALERLDKITGSDQWQASAWWLERQFPEDFSLVQKIEQVLAKHGLISPGIAAQLEDGPPTVPTEPTDDGA